MHSSADSPQFRALSLNHCSVSVPDGTHGLTVGGPWAEDRGFSEAHEARVEEFEGSWQGDRLAISDAREGVAFGSDADLFAGAGGGTPP